MFIATDNVTDLPITPRDNSTMRVLQVVPGMKCFHRRFVVDDTLAEVECADCHEKLSPMWVLRQLAQKENRYHELAARYQDQMKRLAERSRTKCRKCGQMTEISNA